MYLNDILITSETVHEGLAKIEETLKTLRKSHMKLRLEKCKFLFTHLAYLGHKISQEGVRPGQSKTEAVENFPRPKTHKQVRQFLGLVSYFRKFIKQFGVISTPLTRLLQKNVPFTWGENEENAFRKLKQKLAEKPVLAIYQVQAKTEVHTDASKDGLGATLLQEQPDGSMRPVMFYSQRTTDAESAYHSYELETLAIVRALQRFRPITCMARTS